MGASSSILKPQELTEFRKLNTSIENIEIPARPESRVLTDKKGFIIYGITILIFIAFLGYSLSKTDIRRITHGYDNCGNMCGYKSPEIKDVACSGKDYESRPYYNIKFPNKNNSTSYENSECVSECPYGKSPDMFRECILVSKKNNVQVSWNDNRLDDVSETINMSDTWAYLRANWWRFVISILITIALSVFVLFLLRFSPAVVIWTVLAISILALIAITGGLWYAYFSNEVLERNKKGFLIASVFMTVVTIILIIVLACLFKKIRLVIQLYKEATKAVFAMPLLMLIPILATLVQVALLASFIASTTWLATAADLKKYRDDFYQYEMNGVQGFTIFFNFVMIIWSMQFIIGIQYMVLSGSVASWYFAKNKDYLDSPIKTSLCNTMKFHLGTISFGSFILTLFAVIKALIYSIVKNDKARVVLECCCENVEAFLKFLSKNAYIETAIHGQSFIRSGKRAAKLLLTNAASLIAVNSVGDFVLGMIQLILIIIGTGFSILIWKNGPDYWLPSLICFLINIAIVVTIFAIFETTIDTLFICFCEDKVINDGMSKPYYMSRGLMEFVENSKIVYGKE